MYDTHANISFIFCHLLCRNEWRKNVKSIYCGSVPLYLPFSFTSFLRFIIQFAFLYIGINCTCVSFFFTLLPIIHYLLLFIWKLYKSFNMNLRNVDNLRGSLSISQNAEKKYCFGMLVEQVLHIRTFYFALIYLLFISTQLFNKILSNSFCEYLHRIVYCMLDNILLLPNSILLPFGS